MWDWMIYQDITIGSMSHTWGDYECQKLAFMLYWQNINNGSTETETILPSQICC